MINLIVLLLAVAFFACAADPAYTATPAETAGQILAKATSINKLCNLWGWIT